MSLKRHVKDAQTSATKRKVGRPRISNYAKVFADLPPIPENDPLAVAAWAQRLLAIALRETVQGRGHRQNNQEIRAFVNGILRAIPMERLAEVERQITHVSKARRDPSPAAGPPIEVVDESAAPSLRPPLRG